MLGMYRESLMCSYLQVFRLVLPLRCTIEGCIVLPLAFPFSCCHTIEDTLVYFVWIHMFHLPIFALLGQKGRLSCVHSVHSCQLNKTQDSI